MLNEDENLKLKELFDKGIITQEEFEKAKKIEQLEDNNVETNSNGNNKKRKKKSHLIVIVFICMIFAAIIAGAIGSNSINYKTVQQQENEELLIKYSASYEETDKIIKECGFNDYTLEYVGEENKTHYFIIRQKDNITGGLDIKNGKVINVDYNDNALYKNNKFIHTIKDFILTDNEKYNYIDYAKEAVKKQLNYPSTAKFPSLYSEYFVTYKDKRNVTVKGAVTASNAFKVSTTYTFEVIFKNDTVTKVNLY